MGPNSPVGHGSALPIAEHVSKYILKMIYKAQTENINLGNGFTAQEGEGKDLTYYFDNPDAGYEGFLY
jgi:hypothetical protein